MILIRFVVYKSRLVFQNSAIGGDGHDLPLDHLTAILKCGFDGVFDAATAGYFHAHHCDRFDVVLRKNCRQLFAVVTLVKLGTANDGDFVLHKFGTEITAGISGAVSRHRKICIFKIRCIHRHKFYLHRPLV